MSPEGRPGDASSPSGWSRRFEVSERAFKRVAFWSTALGLFVMAGGLHMLLFEGSFLWFLVLFIAGGLTASVSILFHPRHEPGWTVELFTRDMCPLCEEARAWLLKKAGEYDFAVWEVNVDEDPALQEKYGDWVPVAVIGEKELFRARPAYPVVEREFRRLAEQRVRKSGPVVEKRRRRGRRR
jgi:hypothetical protein